MAKIYFVEKKAKSLLEHCMGLRGFTKLDLKSDFATDLHDPFLFEEMKTACELVVELKKADGKATIFGDYDADGTPASVLLSDMFDQIGIANQIIIPKRSEGYGLSEAGVRKAKEFGSLLVTVDNGISAHEPIELAKSLGLKVIVLDHHLPELGKPKADAVIDAFVKDCAYPFKGLCGCGVAFKFAQALSHYFPQINESFLKWSLDLVAISTVGDMVPMRGENRIVTKYGQLVIPKTKRPGLKMLLENAQLKGPITTYGIGFQIAPRLNATGRMGDNIDACKLLKTKDVHEAKEVADRIEKANKSRQESVEDGLKKCRALISKFNNMDEMIYGVYEPTVSSGVVGLIAGKLSQEFYRPVVVMTKVGDVVRGSGRSIPTYDITEGLKVASKYLQTFGGHKQAAGFSLDEANIENFLKAIKADAKDKISLEDIEPSYVAETLADEEMFEIDEIAKLNQLEPFGQTNPKPKILVQNAIVVSRRQIGTDGKHLSLVLKIKELEVRAIFFNGSASSNHKVGESLTAIGYIDINRWRDIESPQLQIVETFDDSVKISPISYEEAKTKFFVY